MREIPIIGAYLILISLFGLLNSCSKEKDYFDDANGEYIRLGCLIDMNGTYIIKTEEAYLQMAKQIYNDWPYNYDCVDTTQAPFDFNEFVLLGKYTTHDSNDGFTRSLTINRSSRWVTYKLEKTVVDNPNTGGFGLIQASGMNWLKISKPPEDFKIRIDYKASR